MTVAVVSKKRVRPVEFRVDAQPAPDLSLAFVDRLPVPAKVELPRIAPVARFPRTRVEQFAAVQE
jgi:hypothetical protein